MNLKVLITVFQKILWFIGVWATIHEISAIKLSKTMLAQQDIFKTLSHSIVNNNIFWKPVTRPFRCIYVNCFNVLRFFCWGQHKIKKMHFFRQFKDHNSGKENENYNNDPIFSSTFSAPPACNISACNISFLNFKILKIHFQFHYFGPFWSVKYLNFFAKSYWFGQLIIRFQKVDTLRLLKIYIMFCLPAEQIPIFLGSSSWTILEFEENFIPNLFAFLLLFWWQKNSF